MLKAVIQQYYVRLIVLYRTLTSAYPVTINDYGHFRQGLSYHTGLIIVRTFRTFVTTAQ